MKKNHTLLVLLLFLFSINSNSQQKVNIAIISDGNDRIITPFEEEIKNEVLILMENKYEVNFTYLNGDFDPAKIQSNLEKAQLDNNVDFVIASGLISSNIAMNLQSHKKPTHATFIIDSELSGAPKKDNASGINNLSYTEVSVDPVSDIEMLIRIYNFKKLGIIIPDLSHIYVHAYDTYFSNILEEFEKPYEFLDASDIKNELNSSDVDAIYFTSFGNILEEEIRAIINEVNVKQLPSFALFGREAVEKGVLAGNKPYNASDIQARRIALNILKTVEGQNPSTFNVEAPKVGGDFVINMLTAEAINYYPNFEVMGEADLLNIENQFTENTYNLRKVIIESLNKNLDIKAANFDIILADKDIKSAIAEYFPNGSASLSGTAVDKAIHENPNAGMAPFNLTAAVGINQAILSIPALSNIIITKLTKEVQKHSNKQVELDVIFESAQAYLNILLAKSNVRIQNENVSVTRSNLNISNKKVSSGYIGQSDKLRWESQFALNKIDLNDALAQLNASRYYLNRYLNNDIDYPFRTEEVDFTDDILMVSDSNITALINDPISLKKFSDFLVQEAFNNLPELKQIEATLAVQEKTVKWQKAAFAAPTISGQAGLNYSFYNSGPNADLLTYDRPYWNSGFSMSIPISSGGKNFIQKQVLKVNIDKINVQKENTEQLLELQIRSNLENVSASYNRMLLSNEAAEAAIKSLIIAQDSYSKGLINVTSLIDVQNSSLQAEQLQSAAVYQFYQNFLSVERSIGFFYSLATEEEKQSFRQRLNTFMILK